LGLALLQSEAGPNGLWGSFWPKTVYDPTVLGILNKIKAGKMKGKFRQHSQK